MKELLFVYGTLRYPKIQKEAFGRSEKGVPNVLKGYEKSKVMIDNEPYPIIKPHKGTSVHGLVLSVTQSELKLLDKYESDIYTRKKVVLTSGKRAWVYQV